MELEDKQVPHTQKYAVGTVALVAGKTLKIETSPAGAELLDAVVPDGKQWSVLVYVRVVETSA